MNYSVKADIGLDLKRKDLNMVSATCCLSEIGQALINEIEHTVL